MTLPRLRLLAAPPSAAAAAPPLLVPRPQALARQLTPSPLLLSLLLPLLLLLLLSPAPASAQLSSAFSYSLPCAPASGNQDAGVRYAVGNTAYLCITLNGQVVSMYNVVVDRFTAIALQGSNLAFPPNSGFIRDSVGNVTTLSASTNSSEARVFYQVFDVAILGASSAYPRIYKKLSYQLDAATGNLIADIVTFPIFTVILTLDNGVVQSVAFDEGCFFCAENTPQCDYSALHANFSQTIFDPTLKGCRLEQSACYPASFSGASLADNNATNATNATLVPPGNATVPAADACDLRVYVVWTGTDARGNGLMSANKRFSRYRQFNVATAYQSALNAADSGYQLAQRTKDMFEAVPGQIVPGSNENRRLGGATAAAAAAAAAEAAGAGAGEAQAPPR